MLLSPGRLLDGQPCVMASFKVQAGTGELHRSSGTSAKISAPVEGGTLAEIGFLASGLLTLASAALPLFPAEPVARC